MSALRIALKMVALAVMVTTATTTAMAAVVTVTLTEPEWFPWEDTGPIIDLTGKYRPMDFDGDGTVDVTFGGDRQTGFVGLRSEGFNRLIYLVDPPPNIGGAVVPLLPGFTIGATLPSTAIAWGSSDPVGGFVSPDEIAFMQIVKVLSTGSASNFPVGGLRAAVGVEFNMVDGSHYGYVDIMAGKGFAGITIYGWAYETRPGVPIVVQAPAAIPEPAAAGLWVGGVSLAVFFFRIARRRGRIC